MISCPRLVITGLGGDSGKTLISTGLARFWKKSGLNIVPFKKGPDYIDMGWLTRAARRPCYNIDLYMMDRDHALLSFSLNTANADIALIEGNRGLYDGMDFEGSVSTAEVAKLLQSPVVLIVNCTKATRTMAAVVKGCQIFDPGVAIRAVILNKLGTSRHESIIRRSIEYHCGIPVVGAIPRNDNDIFPGRHLGLVPHEEHPSAETAIDAAARTVEAYLDTEQIFRIAAKAAPVDSAAAVAEDRSITGVTVGIIRDSAFQFYYPENIESLKRAGARIAEFSALNDSMPEGLDAIYIGGGFPETHAEALAGNESLRRAIRNAAESGLPIYAECGGLMYLAAELYVNEKTYPMAGVFPATVRIDKKPRGHGYTELRVEKSNPYFQEGQILRGHEFHYSYVADLAERDGLFLAFHMNRGKGIRNGLDGLCYRNVLATYTHLHALGCDGWTEGILKLAAKRSGNLIS